jgi:hypothetical protein
MAPTMSPRRVKRRHALCVIGAQDHFKRVTTAHQPAVMLAA